MEETEKYIPPHRRKNKDPSLELTHHASLRMQQRGIDITTTEQTIDQGTLQQDQTTKTYRTAKNFCVVDSGKQVITVMDNHRNTDFDFLRRIKTHEEELIDKVSKNNDFAMCELAELYLDPQSEKFDAHKAYKLFLQAATQKNNSHAMCKLAQLYDGTLLGPRNEKLYWEWIGKAADKNNKYATAIMGQYFMHQYLDLPPDSSDKEKQSIASKAMEYFDRSVAKGSTRAMWHIAYIYQHGLFGEKNLAKAIDIFIDAAKRGSPNSLISLQSLVNSEEIEANQLENILNSVCPIIGDQSSQLAVELAIEQIEGRLGQNKETASIRAIHMLEQAAHHQNEDALLTLIEIYKTGSDIVKADKKKVVFWSKQLESLYIKAVDADDIDAMFNLGELYLSGDLGNIDSIKALEYFNKSVSTKNPDYMYSFGMLLKTDPNIQNNKASFELINHAIRIFEQKVKAGDSESAFSIAEIYYKGDLGYIDYKQAIKWFDIAVNLGDDWSKYYLAKIYALKLPEPNIKLAIKYIVQIIPAEVDIDLQQKVTALISAIENKQNISLIDSAEEHNNTVIANWLECLNVSEGGSKPLSGSIDNSYNEESV